MTRADRIAEFTETIWDWYSRHKRNLPWRDLRLKDETERAYRILVSEVMLQQTQVARVIIIYKRFLEEFPKLKDLAKTSNRDVIMAWRGMGYNSRALRLRDAAKMIVERSKMRKYENAKMRKYRVQFPVEMEELMSIPGIGHYTAAAIRNFAFHIPTPCIETNIRRVLHTAFFGPPRADGTWKVDDKRLLKLAEEVLEVALGFSSSESASADESRSLPRNNDFSTRRLRAPRSKKTLEIRSKKTAEWHAALMDYGALALPKVRTKKKVIRKEPGRMVGSRHIPNRIFRGKIIEELRDAERGLSIHEIGRRVCIDWEPEEHGGWLSGLLKKLEQDTLIQKSGRRFVLSS